MASILRGLTGGDTQHQSPTSIMDSSLDNMAIPHKSLFPDLSLYTRLKLFLIFLLSGFVIAIISLMLIAISLKGFAILYTLATVSCLFSVMFLVGPMEQIKAMVSLTRMTSSILLILCIILTLVAALKWKSALLALLFCVCQFAALLWYTLSYIPYARTIFKHFGGTMCSCCSV